METRRRTYLFCAKGGHDKLKNSGWVCMVHAGGEGLYTHCAVCGKQMSQEPTRDYVCGECLVRTA